MRYAISLLLLIALAGCATPQQQRATTTGAVVGGTAGAIIGAQNDRPVEGAVVGAVLGGLAGAIIAQDRDDQVYVSDARYHRSDCGRGNSFFGRAHNSRHLDEKISLMRQGIRFCPHNPAAHNDLGVALMLWGDILGARQHFLLALGYDPDYRPARYNLNRLASYRSPRYREHREYRGKQPNMHREPERYEAPRMREPKRYEQERPDVRQPVRDRMERERNKQKRYAPQPREDRLYRNENDNSDGDGDRKERSRRYRED